MRNAAAASVSARRRPYTCGFAVIAPPTNANGMLVARNGHVIDQRRYPAVANIHVLIPATSTFSKSAVVDIAAGENVPARAKSAR
jgi:hypothetical protein